MNIRHMNANYFFLFSLPFCSRHAKTISPKKKKMSLFKKNTVPRYIFHLQKIG